MPFELTTDQVVDDALYMHRIISENNPHKFLKERTHNVKWDERKDEFADWAKKVQTPDEYVRLIQRMCDVSQCGHISMNPDFLIALHTNDPSVDVGSPWRLASNNEENYVANQYWSKICEQVNKKKQTDVPQYRHVVHDIEINNDTMYISIPMMRHPDEDILAQYKRIAQSLMRHKNLIIDIRGNCGGGDSAWTMFLSMIISEDMGTPAICFYRSGGHVEPFCRYAYKDYHLKPIDDYCCVHNIAIDETLMTGEYATPFMIYETVKRNEDSVNFSGKIAVIMDNTNFSSAESFLVSVKHNKLATMIGETSGGDGVGCTPAFCILPNSRLCVTYPVILGLNPDGTINDEFPIAPDIRCTVKPFDKPLNCYGDNGLTWLLSDHAVQTAMNEFIRRR